MCDVISNSTYLDGADVGVLGDVLVLIQAILRSLSFTKIDTELDKEKHDRLEGSDGAAPRPLGGRMFVEDIEGGRSLAHGDKFLSPLRAECELEKAWQMIPILILPSGHFQV
jgi:hypothetical protein